MKKKLFYIWFVPALWAVFSTASFFYPSDEYICMIGAIVGMWICRFHPFEHNFLSLFLILLAGGIVMAILGFVMDLLSVKKKLWFSIFIVATFFIFISVMGSFHSIEQIRWKHRSVFAPVFMSLGLGVHLAVIFSIIITGLKRIMEKQMIIP